MKIADLKVREPFKFSSLLIIFALLAFSSLYGLNYEIVDTAQQRCFDNSINISAPTQGESFYGQDAQFEGNQPDYTDNGDGTITDNVTGLMWTKSCDLNQDGIIDVDDKLSYQNAINTIDDVDIAGYNDWRIPSIKEIYSLIMFSGIDPSGFEGSPEDLVPFINTDYFDFAYGDTNAGERLIDAQMISTAIYVADQSMMFGVNFADGRIKGYGTGPMPGQTEDKLFYVYYVRGNPDYGINDFQDNGDNTISDNATGLMWSKYDSGEALNWQDALEWVTQKNNENYLGYSDWRMPNVKELQSILDYSRSPDTSSSPAIDSLFESTQIINVGGETDYPYIWSSTTHENWTENNGGFASYVSFGRALGWMEDPPMSGNYQLQDVHGAGAQRSDPKDGNPDDYPYGNGPQGDVIRIFNYVRLVRDFEPSSDADETNLNNSLPSPVQISNYPNPFNPSTTISYNFDSTPDSDQKLTIYNLKGEKVKEFDNLSSSGSIVWNGYDLNENPVASGVYFSVINYNSSRYSQKMLLVK